MDPAPIATISVLSSIRLLALSAEHAGSSVPSVNTNECGLLKFATRTPLFSVTEREHWNDISLTFEMSQAVRKEINELFYNGDVDIVLVPFPVMQALRDTVYYDGEPRQPIGKCRVCRVADRVTKVIYADRFCI